MVVAVVLMDEDQAQVSMLDWTVALVVAVGHILDMQAGLAVLG